MVIPRSPSLTASRESADPEIAELKWSLGFVGGRIVLHESKLRRLRKLVRRRTLEESLRIAAAHAFIHVYGVDDATIDTQIHLVNFSGKEILIEQAGVDWLGVSSGHVAVSGPTLHPS